MHGGDTTQGGLTRQADEVFLARHAAELERRNKALASGAAWFLLANSSGDTHMLRVGFLAGVLLATAGVLLLLLIAMGVGLTLDGTDTSLVGVNVRSFLTIAAALCLASGITLVGLGFGHWQHPRPEGTPGQRH